MKSIEEKAKAYDEALASANEMIKSMTNIGGVAKVDDIQHIFPELKESEDEKWIPKEIIKYLKEKGDFRSCWIAWLEKQGVHAKFINGIQVGDKVTRSEYGVLVNLSKLNRVANKQGEQKLLYVNDNAKEMFIKALERVEEQNKKGYKLTDCDKNSWWEDFKAYTSCIIEQKPAAWSKEDENIIVKIKTKIAQCNGFNKKNREEVFSLIDSLRPQSTWKPSDEQMNTLEYYMHTLICNEHKEVLFGLYADLKKLREE